MDIKERIKALPADPGVYIMKDMSGNVLYVGKAGNLRRRVSSYFRGRGRSGGRIDAMVSRIDDIEYIRTSTEAEALIYENGLIKKLSPKYNVALKDGKSYPMLKLTVNEEFPRLLVTRRDSHDGAIYFGPYADARLLRLAVDALRQIFPLRKCARMEKRPCLNYHLKQCLGPCAGLIGKADYSEMVAELKLYLAGRRGELISLLSEKMAKAAALEDFERASAIKARLEALSLIKAKAVSYGPAKELEELRAVLGFESPIETIEAFDVSNISGEFAVGSMACFYKGRPKKSAYRKFRIRTVKGPDDYAMIREIVRRRYSKLIEGGGGEAADLIVIDGGRGHLAAAVKELDDLGLAHLPVIGIAKEREIIYVKGRKDPLVLPGESKALHMIERIRDEAHRFAISYHKSIMSKRARASELDEIPGIGEKRKNALLRHFGEIHRIRSAGLEELMKVKGIDERSARGIIGHFKK